MPEPAPEIPEPDLAGISLFHKNQKVVGGIYEGLRYFCQPHNTGADMVEGSGVQSEEERRPDAWEKQHKIN